MLGGSHPVGGDEVEEQAEHAGPLDVAQELQAQAPALAGSLDEAGDVGHDELGAVPALPDPHDTQVRDQGRERIVGDLRLGRADAADEGALAGVGEADEGHVGHELQLEPEPMLLAGLTLLGEARRPALVAQELGVAPPSPTPGSSQEAVAVAGQVGQGDVAVELVDDRALRDVDLEVGAPLAVQVLAPAVGTTGRPPVRMVAEGQQRGDVAVGHQPDLAAAAAIASVGAAVGDRTLPAEADAARAPVPAADVESALVDEGGHGRSRLPADRSGTFWSFARPGPSTRSGLRPPGGLVVRWS